MIMHKKVSGVVISVSLLLFFFGFNQNAVATLIGPGDSARVDFDFTGVSPAPPYQSFFYYMTATANNPFNIGNLFKISIFDSSDSNVYSGSWHLQYAGPFTGISGGSSLTTALATVQSYMIISDIEQQFDLQTVTIGYDAAQYMTHVPTQYPGEISISATTVPEPYSFALMGIGLAAIGFSLKKKHN